MTNEAASIPVLSVSSPPHWHCGRSVQNVMLDFIIALLPALLFALIHYGFDALRVVCLSCVTAVLVEAACQKAMERDISVDNYSALLTGMLFAFLLPASAPWWLVIMGATVSIALGKMAFGGLGANPVCAPLVGWAALRISWPDAMNPNVSLLTSPLENPLTQLKYMGLENVDVGIGKMLIGSQLGPLGSTQILALLIGAAFLLMRRDIRYHIPAGFLGGVFVMGLVFWLGDSSVHPGPFFHIFAGSTIFGAFFLATDTASSPVGNLAMILFGVLAGAMVVIIRVYGIYPDGVVFAVLLANLFTPLIDMIKPKPFGAR